MTENDFPGDLNECHHQPFQRLDSRIKGEMGHMSPLNHPKNASQESF